jgi:outer membrane murein-binding lipoprotein Lpp
MIKPLRFILAAWMLSAVVLVGCSNRPSDAEMRQLQDLRREVGALDKEVGQKQKDKAALEQRVAETNGKIQQCQSDQQAVKKAMGGGQ